MGRTKQDRAKLSKQEWEIDYIRKLAKKALIGVASGKEIKRIAKALLKFTK